MKELTTQQVNEVNGGLLGLGLVFGGIGAVMGTAIGGIVDAGCKAGGYTTNFKQSGAMLGGGIGAAVGLSPVLATAGIGFGVTGIVGNAKSIKAQKGL
ncbi:class IIb bacteriocin, lactobin A/cerein 7B family [Morganella psychrotolerans]|uniref:Class IIb bacteriocin, lactobin A/cerein 7B family n=1 Tax=Morganella psychrotolerans TaxID=368603 RepID=A0A1B8HB01_9GAMM|nr:class IIb bacteriocin, lactobin A/cerein 7B family [Morganella psychrotolerans]OBU06241.1 hypothetical protein AYY18_07040 [Morganella psychrotolerans]